jgi:2,4-dienoyl-CoA reductase-like NADH-dependent reductase (Old Yellow Enzyme family)
MVKLGQKHDTKNTLILVKFHNFMVLFSPLELDSITVENRIVKSATAESMADDDGFVTEKFVEFYKRLAEGGAGVAITGHMFVMDDGKAHRKMTGISRDEHVSSLKKMIEEVKKVNKTQILVAQISHAGRQGPFNPVAPSPIPDPVMKVTPRELTKEEIEEIIDSFGDAARRAEKAGFDAVQLHAAHGYLLSEFISPHTNRRKDEYGKERAKILLDIKERIDEKTRIPVLIKMNANDFIPGGLEIDEAMRIAKLLEKAGFEAIEVSGGMFESAHHTGYNVVCQNVSKSGEGYFKEFTKKIKEAVSIPVIAVGGIRSKAFAERLIKEGYADMVSMARPLIRDPYLPIRWMRNEIEASDCKSCNLCLRSVSMKELGCYSD